MMKRPDSLLAPVAAETLGKTGNPRSVLVLIEAFKAPDPRCGFPLRARSGDWVGDAR